ncbi:hypothetical protein SAMN05421874_11433 [Nonomuraea maritima]|uniref:Uncharacterized protein n=1 Tax=Nonomuraea maritima TaxID=683260 RepID=A0A1G9GF57_9ACTN|nr:hypothetical protein SAMN05421874_11433 [Nonomuraea maritima]
MRWNTSRRAGVCQKPNVWLQKPNERFQKPNERPMISFMISVVPP